MRALCRTRRAVDQFCMISLLLLFSFRWCVSFFVLPLQCEANRCAVCVYEKFISFIIELNNRPFASSAAWRESTAHRLCSLQTHIQTSKLHLYCSRFVFVFGVFRTRQTISNQRNAFFCSFKWIEMIWGVFFFLLLSVASLLSYAVVMSLQFFIVFDEEREEKKHYIFH